MIKRNHNGLKPGHAVRCRTCMRKLADWWSCRAPLWLLLPPGRGTW